MISKDEMNSKKRMTTMKRLCLITLSIACVANFATIAFGEDDGDEAPARPRKKSSAPAQDQRMVIAIEKFENKSDASSDYFNTLRDRITDSVINTRKFQVVERERLKAVLSEQKLAESGVTGEDGDAPTAGKMKAAGYIMYGTVLFMGMDKNDTDVAGLSASKTTAKVELQLRFASGESGKILSSKTVVSTKSQARTATEGNRTTGNVTDQAIRDAIADAAKQVTDALMELSFPAKILAVSRNSVSLNLTQEQVEEDDLYDVFAMGEELKDPDTGESLGPDEEHIGRLRITRPGPKTSRAEPVGKLDIEELEAGMLVRRVSEKTLKKESAKARATKKATFESRF